MRKKDGPKIDTNRSAARPASGCISSTECQASYWVTKASKVTSSFVHSCGLDAPELKTLVLARTALGSKSDLSDHQGLVRFLVRADVRVSAPRLQNLTLKAADDDGLRAAARVFHKRAPLIDVRLVPVATKFRLAPKCSDGAEAVIRR